MKTKPSLCAPILLATWIGFPTVTSAVAANESDARSADPPSSVTARTPSAPESPSTPGRVAGRLHYATLMKMSADERSEFFDKLPSEERDNFVAALDGPYRAVLLVDPDDCGRWAKLKRHMFVKGKPPPGLLAGGAQDVAQSAVSVAMDRFIPGVSNAVTTAARFNELNKSMAYRDVCDLPPEAKALLLTFDGRTEAPEGSLVDKASEFFAR